MSPSSRRAVSEPVVSIVVPTFNRRENLQACVEAIRATVAAPFQLVVVDGGSCDDSREWLATQPDVDLICEAERQGAVRAFNRGFRAATGKYVAWLNDDAYPLPHAIDAAIAMIERPDLEHVGMVALYHTWRSRWNILDSVEHDGETFAMCNVRGVPYANFGLLRRTLLAQLGYADERFYFFGWDPDLSLKVQFEAELEVIGCRAALVSHQERLDARKHGDLEIGAADNAKLFAKWPQLPAKFAYPDPAPGYREMLMRRGLFELSPGKS